MNSNLSNFLPEHVGALLAGSVSWLSTADPRLLLAIFILLAMTLWIIRDRTLAAHSDRESALRSFRGDARNRDQAAADEALLEIFRCGKRERDVEMSLLFWRIFALALAVAVLAAVVYFLLSNSS